VKDLRSVCLILGPYRNLTTLLSAVLFLHPNCQVLNHAEDRVLQNKNINFLSEYSPSKFDAFCRFVLTESQGGKRGRYGGSITLSHAFDHKNMKETFRKRYGDQLLKSTINSIAWKGDLRITNFIRNNNIDIPHILEQNPPLRFLLPVRNPLDCTLSSIKTGHIKLFPGLKTYSPEAVLEKILETFLWFVKQKNEHDDRFMFFFQHEINRKLLMNLADFLELEPEERWINSSLKTFQIKPANYDHPGELIKTYKRLINQHFEDYPVFQEGLSKFLDKRGQPT